MHQHTKKHHGRLLHTESYRNHATSVFGYLSKIAEGLRRDKTVML